MVGTMEKRLETLEKDRLEGEGEIYCTFDVVVAVVVVVVVVVVIIVFFLLLL